MNKTLRIVLTFVIPAIIAFLFWAIVADNFFVMIGLGIPGGIGTGLLFSIVDYFFISRPKVKNKLLVRFFVMVLVFILVTVIHLLIEKGEVIEPLKRLMKEF